jgi:starch synthase
MGARIAFDEPLAHKIIAGSDMFVMPSRYEPSGLTQIYSLRYGTIPIVRATGGLKDTIEELDPKTGKGNGFTFGPHEVGALLEAVDRALALLRRKEEWATLLNNAMTADFSWDRSALAYVVLYQKLVRRTFT